MRIQKKEQIIFPANTNEYSPGVMTIRLGPKDDQVFASEKKDVSRGTALIKHSTGKLVGLYRIGSGEWDDVA